MFLEIDLLVVDNLTRHIENKLKKLNEINELSSNSNDNLIHESLLPAVISYFEASIIDTIREYILARPYKFTNDMIDEFKQEENNKRDILESGLEEYLVEKFISNIDYKSLKDKIKQLRKICDIEYEIGNENWEFVKESIARRHCLIHNDLIVNNVYFKQAGRKADDKEQGKRLNVTKEYLEDRIDRIKIILIQIKDLLKAKYVSNTNVTAVKNIWDYLFENRHPLSFDECWSVGNNTVIYKGPTVEELKEMVSPRTICLFTAWMSFFNSYGFPDVKYFSEIFYNSREGRELYSQKLKYLMNSFEKIDFLGFNVKVYDKD